MHIRIIVKDVDGMDGILSANGKESCFSVSGKKIMEEPNSLTITGDATVLISCNCKQELHTFRGREVILREKVILIRDGEVDGKLRFKRGSYPDFVLVH
jgi:hypothetical protein